MLYSVGSLTLVKSSTEPRRCLLTLVFSGIRQGLQVLHVGDESMHHMGEEDKVALGRVEAIPERESNGAGGVPLGGGVRAADDMVIGEGLPLIFPPWCNPCILSSHSPSAQSHPYHSSSSWLLVPS